MRTLHRATHFLILFALMNIAHAQQMNSKDKILNEYVIIQEQLAAENFSSINSLALNLSKSITKKSDTDLKIAVDKLSKAKNIKEARKEFKEISSLLIKKNTLLKDYITAYCPMAGAKWIQKKGELRNPYLGKEMLTCGEQI